MRHVTQTIAHEVSLPRTNEAPLVLITSWGGGEETNEVSLMFQGLLVGLTVVQRMFRHVVDKHTDDEEKRPLEWWCRARTECVQGTQPLDGWMSVDLLLPAQMFTFPLHPSVGSPCLLRRNDWLLRGVLNLESHSLQLLTGSPA